MSRTAGFRFSRDDTKGGGERTPLKEGLRGKKKDTAAAKRREPKRTSSAVNAQPGLKKGPVEGTWERNFEKTKREVKML